MKLRTVIYTLLLATLCMGCGSRISMRQLEQLETRINDAPDSVLTVLTATDMPRWGEARALYALLTVQAQDKNGLDVADDSLIRVATRYYDYKGQPLHRLQAFYYHGRVYANAGLSHEAMTAYTRAEEFADKVDAPYSVGLLYAQMGVLYGNDYDYQRTLESMEKALNYFELADNERLQYLTKLNIGQFHLNTKNTEQAESLLMEVLTWGEAHNDTNITYNTLDLLFRLYDAKGDTVALDTLLNKFPIEKALSNAVMYGIVAHYYAKKKDTEAAETSLSRAQMLAVTAQDTAILLFKSYQVNKALGRTDAALHDFERLFALQDSTVRITLQQPLIASQRDHYETRLKVEELRNQQQRYLMRGAAAIALMAAVVLGVYVRNHFRHKQEELNGYMELAEDLRARIYAHENSVAHMQKQITELFGNYSTLLNSLGETYSKNIDLKTTNKYILSQLEKEIKNLRKGDKLAALENILNTNLDNIIVRLRSELPHLREKDYTFLIYLYARFSGNTIAAFMDLQRNNIYQIKFRLRDEIKASNAPSKEFFLENMP